MMSMSAASEPTTTPKSILRRDVSAAAAAAAPTTAEGVSRKRVTFEVSCSAKRSEAKETVCAVLALHRQH